MGIEQDARQRLSGWQAQDAERERALQEQHRRWRALAAQYVRFVAGRVEPATVWRREPWSWRAVAQGWVVSPPRRELGSWRTDPAAVTVVTTDGRFLLCGNQAREDRPDREFLAFTSWVQVGARWSDVFPHITYRGHGHDVVQAGLVEAATVVLRGEYATWAAFRRT